MTVVIGTHVVVMMVFQTPAMERIDGVVEGKPLPKPVEKASWVEATKLGLPITITLLAITIKRVPDQNGVSHA